MLTIDDEIYFTVPEACAYLGISRETLRIHARLHGFSPYKQSISKSIYYRKIDLDRLREMRPVSPADDVDTQGE